MSAESRLLETRKYLRLNQTEFASRMGFGRSVVADIERGQTKVSAKVLEAVMRSFSANVSWLLTGEGSMFLPSEEEKAAARPSLDSLVATKDELDGKADKAELTQAKAENAALKRQLDEQDKRIAALEDLAKSYLPDIASRGYEGGGSAAPSSPVAAKGAKR